MNSSCLGLRPRLAPPDTATLGPSTGSAAADESRALTRSVKEGAAATSSVASSITTGLASTCASEDSTPPDALFRDGF